jgi:hypothetical protein
MGMVNGWRVLIDGEMRGMVCSVESCRDARISIHQVHVA